MTTIFVLTDAEAGAVQGALTLYVEDEAFEGERASAGTAIKKVRRQRSSLTADEIAAALCALAKKVRP